MLQQLQVHTREVMEAHLSGPEHDNVYLCI